MRRYAPLLLGLSPLVAGCFTLVGPPSSGSETDEISCADDRDNDQDGRIDCEDEDCLMRQFCGVYIPNTEEPYPENTYDSCHDGIDNDDDGQFDCGDRGCQGIMELCCLTEVDDATCSNGVDDDGNGFADCQDFSCRNNRFVTACAAETDCGDRIDNDGDRRTDCNDTDCATSVDCAPPPEADCTNGADDNGNRRTDCADPGCYEDAACRGAENSLAFCSDGNDNDGNGFVDCADFACTMASRGATPEAIAYCMDRMEGTLPLCSDGMDNDGNGFTDCADFSCSRSTDTAILEYCAEHTETTLERCMDGVDNDGHGFVDCADFGGSRSTDPAVAEHCRLIGEATFAACTDRRDNDGNGFVDCADFSCDFLRVGWGANSCDSDEECASGERCQGQACVRSCDGGCPPGTQCEGTTNTCVQSCVSDSDCDPGESCYRTRCLELRSPCSESVWLDEDQTVQGGGMIATDSTRAERVAMSVRLCTDGIDNDGDGFTDCEDWECNYNPLVVDNEDNPICRTRTGPTCIVGPRAGSACASDADCGDIGGSCADPGAPGQAFVCP